MKLELNIDRWQLANLTTALIDYIDRKTRKAARFPSAVAAAEIADLKELAEALAAHLRKGATDA